MPNTSTGTAYTTYTATPSGGDQTLWGVADDQLEATGIPLVVYTHGNEGPYNQFATLSAWTGLRNWLIDHGWAWVESAGGGSSSWGNADARTSYEAATAHVRGVLDVGPIVVLGRSMGGLVSYWLYTQSTFADDCVGLIVNSGTTDLSRRTGDAGAQAAFDMASSSDPGWAAALAEYNPMQFDLSLWDGTNVLEIVGSADTTVPPDEHGLAIRELWAGRPAIDLLDVRAGGDHSAENGSYFQVPAMTSFLQEVTGTAPAPAPGILKVVHAYIKGESGQLFEFAPNF